MPTARGWLVDKSAFERLGDTENSSLWAERVQRGLIGVGTPTLLEIGYSARNLPEWVSRCFDPPVGLMPLVSLTPAIESRAVEVQGLLAGLGQHRAPSVPDLLLAATAELSGLTMLHCDKDFDLIAQVTRQPVQKLSFA